MNILLMGNPNVGKSVVFSRLTGTSVISSNYPGTTVSFTEGKMKWKDKQVNIIDVPGTYTLNPTNKAEEVAVEMIGEGDLIINVVDATNLERNLDLTLQILERDKPVIVALNMWDEAQHKGIKIDYEKLSEKLGVPVIPTVATKGNGFREIIDLFSYREIASHKDLSNKERWAKIGEIVEEIQVLTNRKHTIKDWLDEFSIKPLTGIPIAIAVLALTFYVIINVGEGIIDYITNPFFTTFYEPLMVRLSDFLGNGTLVHSLLIGELIEGAIDFEQSFGVLTTGIYIPFAAVFPFIISFYFALGILEDTGYLPRLSVLIDNVMHVVGLHGFSIIPMVLGFGCNVPAALAARNLDSKREKFIASTLMAISIPCIAQTAMIFGILGPFGGQYVALVFFFLAVIWLVAGMLMNKLVPGFSTDLLIEIPHFRVPSLTTVIKKLVMRVKSFLMEAIPMVLIGVFVVNLLYSFGVFEAMTAALGPYLKTLFGLPEEAISVLLMGFLRKDLAMGMLMPLDLTVKQLIISSTLLAVYFPCVATFAVLVRELGFKEMLKSTFVMMITTLVVGTLLNMTLTISGLSILGWFVIAGIIAFAIIFPKIERREKESDVI
ncbi:MAG: FeoB small GTPase domain-containing protein [Clostridia bacterium]